MDAHTHLPADSSSVAHPQGGMVLRFLLRVAKLFAVAVVSMALLIFGIVWLVEGLADNRLGSIIAGGAALAAIAGGFVYVVRQSHKQAQAAVEAIDAKRQVGLWTCPACRVDFEEATAPRTPKPWYYTAGAIAVALVAIGFGGLALWAREFLGAEPTVKAGLILLIGVAILFHAIKSSRELHIRCPKCGRICGTADPQPRGFPVAPPRPENRQF